MRAQQRRERQSCAIDVDQSNIVGHTCRFEFGFRQIGNDYQIVHCAGLEE